MLNLKNYEFGEPISFHNKDGHMGANAMISQFLNMKEKYKKSLEDVAKEDPHAKRYFCKNDCAYIFRVEILEAIVSAIKAKGDDGKGCLVLFQGLKKTKKTCSFGQPTVIATAYALKGDVIEWIPVPYENKKNTEGEDGFQHPGDGTGPGSGSSASSGTNKKDDDDITSPVVDPGEPHGDTDFVIKRSLKADNLDGFKK